MEKTDIILTSELKMQALQHALKMGISLEQFIRNAIEKSLKEFDNANVVDDPFLADNAVFSGETPPDLAQNHDVYLYGENL